MLHDFWVPAFRMKKDAVPGINVTYRVTPNRLGTYPIVCAELCGLGHADDARDRRRASDQRSTTTWLADARQAARAGAPAAAPAAAAPADGKAIFASTGNCAAATRWPTPAPTGTVGPDLDKVLADKDEAFIKDVDRRSRQGDRRRLPERHHARNYEQTAAAAQLDALVKYLSEVTKGG